MTRAADAAGAADADGPDRPAGPVPFGYFDRWTARPGEVLELKVSSEADYAVSIVRVVQGDAGEHGPGQRLIAQEWWPRAGFAASVQAAVPGSRARTDSVPFLAGAREITLEVIVKPGVLAAGRRQVVAALVAADGSASLSAELSGSGEARLRVGNSAPRQAQAARDEGRLRARRWYRARLTVSLDGGFAGLTFATVDRAPGGPHSVAVRADLSADELRWLAGAGRPDRLVLAAGAAEGDAARLAGFTGKIEAPALSATGPAGTSAASWDLSRAAADMVAEAGGYQLPLRLVNKPAGAVTGHSWDGSVLDFRQAPAQYAALAFHDDDLTDAGWQTTATVALPPDLASGVYAARLSAAAGERYLPFFVVPAAAGPRNRIAVLLPTFTYLAYANEHVRDEVSHFEEQAAWPSRQDLEITARRDFGLSLYDRHADGTGVCYSSTLRPVLNFDPTYRFWLFGGPVHLGEDLYLLDWLEREGHGYDVVTDHLLHAEGAAALDGYTVVLTGSHPEYSSSQLIDALEAHVEAGGRLMYLGGNGFYWVTSVDPDTPSVIEIRRGTSGSRVWESAPGECYHSTTGEPGGIWRYRGRPPNRLTGIGFAAQGADAKAPGYRRVLAAELEDDWGFVFDGIAAGQIIGDTGLLLGGAAGNEIDRADYTRGTPDETVVLATSTGHSDAYQLTLEDMLLNAPGQGGAEQPLVRSDITVTPYASGGCVFSAGAITWLGALAQDDYDNLVARMMRNVLERFLRGPVPASRSPQGPEQDVRA